MTFVLLRLTEKLKNKIMKKKKTLHILVNFGEKKTYSTTKGRTVVCVIQVTHLHDETLFMGASCLCRQLVLQAAAFLIQLHHRVLPMLGQDRTLVILLIARRQVAA